MLLYDRGPIEQQKTFALAVNSVLDSRLQYKKRLEQLSLILQSQKRYAPLKTSC